VWTDVRSMRSMRSWPKRVSTLRAVVRWQARVQSTGETVLWGNTSTWVRSWQAVQRMRPCGPAASLWNFGSTKKRRISLPSWSRRDKPRYWWQIRHPSGSIARPDRAATQQHARTIMCRPDRMKSFHKS
jgi:hypothetical protein